MFERLEQLDYGAHLRRRIASGLELNPKRIVLLLDPSQVSFQDCVRRVDGASCRYTSLASSG